MRGAVETLRADVVLGDGEPEVRDLARRCDALGDLDHVLQELGADALALIRRQDGEREQDLLMT